MRCSGSSGQLVGAAVVGFWQEPLLDAYPEAMPNDELAVAANYAPGPGGFNNSKGRLRTLGLINYPSRGMSAAADILFID